MVPLSVKAPGAAKEYCARVTGEGAAAQTVVLHVIHTPLCLTFMLWNSDQTGQQRAAVVATKAQQLWIEIRIIPVGFPHGGAQIIEVQNLHDSAKAAKRVFQATDKVLGGLVEHGLAVSLA